MLFLLGLALIAFSLWCKRRTRPRNNPRGGEMSNQAIVANRSLYALLVTTNTLGTNTPAIMEVEAHYAELLDKNLE